MPCVGFEPTIPAFKRAKRVHHRVPIMRWKYNQVSSSNGVTVSRSQSLCNILSDKRMGLSFTIAAGIRSSFTLRSESRRTHYHILLSQNRDSPTQSPGSRIYIASARTTYKTPPILVAYCCTRYPATSCLPRTCLRGNLPSNGNPCYNIVASCWTSFSINWFQSLTCSTAFYKTY
jgi:hypothetical protein